MKPKNNFFRWCKTILMALPVVAMLTFVACEKEETIAVTGVSLNRPTLALTTGGTATLTATVTPGNATDKTVTWESNDKAIATVSDEGVVTAGVTEGAATITVTTADGGHTDVCMIMVDDNVEPVTGVTLSAETYTLLPGGTFTLTATVAPGNATDKAVTWESSSTVVATVSNKGVVTAGNTAGAATITVTTVDGAHTATCGITVTVVPVTGVTLSAETYSLLPGGTFTLIATVAPDNATNKAVKWESSSTVVATVSDEGVVTAVSGGTVTITVTTADGGHTATSEGTIFYVIDFEDPRVEDYLADSPYGENLYDGSYYGYDDAATGLFMLPTNESSYGFASGGIAISRWNDMTKGENAAEWYKNQCSVYYRDPTNGNGGHNGSPTFAVHYGNNNEMFWDGRTQITFDDNAKSCIFDHFYVTNNTYAVLSLTYGDGFAEAHSYENKHWFKLIIEGIDKNGNSTGTVDFYLSDFRTPDSPGIITEWTKVDLSSLGEVTKILFDMQGSDDNGYGVATPVYFCFDDLVVRQIFE
jgi:uncharacterized protein YjdB